MNENNLNVPITHFACLSSLTDLLPELPVPSPAPVASNPNYIIFHNQGVAEQATRATLHNDANLASSLGQALAATNVDYLDIRDPACKVTTVPQTPLTQTILRTLPAAFGQSAQDVGNSLPQQSGPMVQWGPGSNAPHVVQQNGTTSGQSNASNSPAPHVNHAGGVQEQAKPMQYKQPKINLGMSKEDQALMTKKLETLEPGSYNSRSTRNKKYAEIEESESESDDENKKKSKFFKHTEKERDDQRRQRREDRRKQRDDEEDYQPPADDGGRKRRHPSGEDNETDENNWLKRRKKEEESSSAPPTASELDNYVPKKVFRKIERKLVQRAQKIDPDTIMESSNFQKFNRTLENIFDACEEVNIKELEENEDGTVPPEILITKYQAHELATEAAKLKSLDAMDNVPVEKLVKLLNIMQWTVKDGSVVTPLAERDEDDEDDRLFLEVAAERVSRAADVALCAMHIMTSKNMNKRVFIDDVIDKIVLYARFQLQNTIYPSYDPVYKEMSKHKEGYTGSMKKKRNYGGQVRDKNITKLYSKCNEIVGLLSDLLKIQLMTDTTVLHLSTLGVAPFFVENVSELQLNALRLVTGVFSKYEKHRKLILDDILASIARLPSSKHSLRTFRKIDILDKDKNIQMLTALVLQLIQCVVILPDKLGRKKEKGNKKEKMLDEDGREIVDPDEGMDRDVLINTKYESAMATAVQFLTAFLKKCGSKSEETDFRPLFENFLQDLLITVNTPEWPAAELLLSLLGKILTQQFLNKGTEVALRITSLDYLGAVASKLRRDAVQSRLKLDTINSIIKSVREAEQESGLGGAAASDDMGDDVFEDEDKRTRFLQRVLLDYLTVTGGEDDPNTRSSRHFYISQWFRDANAEIRRSKGIDKKKKKPPSNNKRRGRNETESEASEDENDTENDESKNQKLAEVFRLTEERKTFLVSKISPFGDNGPAGSGKAAKQAASSANFLSCHIDEMSASLIVKYLSSKRPFFNSFDVYLKHIINVLTEQSIQVRSKALKCLASIVHEDPSVLSRADMKEGVEYSFQDAATMVREAAVDLVGKFILHKAELVDRYYDMLSSRILDTGVSVRKRVIKILKDICLEFPDYPKIPEICVKMIRRINDEEGIRKLVMEVFQNMWFVPVNDRRRTEKEQHALVIRAQNITEVVVNCKNIGHEDRFEQFLQTLFKPKEDKDDATKIAREPPKHIVTACQQIVDCLIETVLKSEEKVQQEGAGESSSPSTKIGACLMTTYLFARIRPQLLINHVQTLQPYLNIKIFTHGDNTIVSNVAKTLELVVPLIEHPSEIFLSQLEEASVKLILNSNNKDVVGACLSCLGSIVNNVTKNYSLMRECFRKYYQHIVKFKENSNLPQYRDYVGFWKRSLYNIGMLLRYFDFSSEDLYAGLETGAETVRTAFDIIFYFVDYDNTVIQLAALQCLGNMAIRNGYYKLLHFDLMLIESMKEKYIDILTRPYRLNIFNQHDSDMILQVLTNIETYLIEEDKRMIERDKHWKELAKVENLKEMGDVSSGMASTIIQIFLKAILESFIHDNVSVRFTALKVIQLILSQGLVHPVQIVPYLICMSTDMEQRVSHTADRELQEIEKKYPGFIHMKLMQGIRLSYKLQAVLSKSLVLRGFRETKGEIPAALNGFLYSCLRSTKAQRRAILVNLLRQFDVAQDTSLSMMLYLADNLAYIPYTVIDEPLFLIHRIDLMVSVIGPNILLNIKKGLKLPPTYETKRNPETGEEEFIYDEDLDDDKTSILSRLPDNLEAMHRNLITSQGCILLLILREHLKEFYGINEAKITQYNPSETQKIYERAVNRRGNARFNPKATLEILKQKEVDVTAIDDEGKEDLVKKYLGFKELMNKIEKDEEEYDEDGNVIPQAPVISAKELQNMGMPVYRANHQVNGAGTNGGGGGGDLNKPPPPVLPPNIHGRPEKYNPVIRLQNIPVSGLPSGSSADPHEAPDDGSGGYLDPETGDWVPEKPSSKKQSVTPGKTRDKDSSKVPSLKINLGGPRETQNHAFFADLDKTERERSDRRSGRSTRASNTHASNNSTTPNSKSKKSKKSKSSSKKNKYRSESEESSAESDSDIEYID